MSKIITLRPRLSEKTYGLSVQRTYVVDVPTDVNKHTVARAVEAQFEVKVSSVNIMNLKGKAKRVISLTGKRLSNTQGKRNDLKKAYVTLAEGHSLPFFEAIEQEEQKEQATQEKIDKVAAKQASKATAKKAAPKAKAEPKTETVEETPQARHGWRLPKMSRKGKDS
jgi:large subunit ribosomal protein L23